MKQSVERYERNSQRAVPETKRPNGHGNKGNVHRLRPLEHSLSTRWKCARCLLQVQVKSHGLPSGWTLVRGESGAIDTCRCDQCVKEVAAGSPEKL